jgi:curved DNA-binding protein CbpA
MADPYSTLGVARGASEAEIKSAYRKLAKELHPDRNQDNPKAAERFSAVSSAYDLLSDKDKRARFDRGEIDGDGNPTAVPARAAASNSTKARISAIFSKDCSAAVAPGGGAAALAAASGVAPRRRRARTSLTAWPSPSSMPPRWPRSASPCRTARPST